MAATMSLTEMLTVVLASFLALVVISFFVETLRPSPQPPEKLVWAPSIPIRYVTRRNGSRMDVSTRWLTRLLREGWRKSSS